jgi:hypothetical protein
MRYLLIILYCCLFCGTSYAQQILTAKVLENKTRIVLPNIRVHNLTNKQNTFTDTKGQFSIRASVNDILVFTGYQYQNDTLLITDLKPKEIFLEPQTNLLQQVDIFTPEVHMGSIADPEFHNQTMVYQRDADGHIKGGVAFRIWSNKSGEKKRAKMAKMQQNEETKLEIARVFTSNTIKQYLPLKPDEMDGFITRYIPSVKVYRANNFNLLFYLNNCYKEFVKLPPQQRVMQKLTN